MQVKAGLTNGHAPKMITLVMPNLRAALATKDLQTSGEAINILLLICTGTGTGPPLLQCPYVTRKPASNTHMRL